MGLSSARQYRHLLFGTPDQAETEVTSGEGSRQAVFIIDDDDSIGAGVVMLLNASGYPARGFSSAEAFLAEPRPNAWGCGLVDVHMPGMDGLTLVELLHARGAPPPELLLMTGRETPELHRRARQASVTKVLSKPLDPAQVVDAVRRALARPITPTHGTADTQEFPE